MRLTVQPTFLPGTAGGACYLCKLSPRKVDHAGTRERNVDTGVMIHMEGGLAICETCVLEMAGLFDMVPQADHDAAIAGLQEQDERNLAEIVALHERTEAAEARAQEAEQAFALAARLKEQPVPKPAPKPRAPKQLAEPARA